MSTEEVRRLAARSLSDCKRGVPFEVGFRHFAEFVIRALEVMDQKLMKMEELSKGGKDGTNVSRAP